MDIEDWSFSCNKEELIKRKQFGEFIKSSRRAANLNMNDLAAKANISGDALLRIESGLVSSEIPSIRNRLLRALEREVMVIA